MNARGKKLLLLGLMALGVWWVVSKLVTFKPGVNQTGVSARTWLAVNVAAAIRAALGGGLTTVTALVNGDHMTGSLHYQGLAADLRAHDLTAALQQKWFELVKSALSLFGFDVLLEGAGTANAHIHVEYDPKGSATLGG